MLTKKPWQQFFKQWFVENDEQAPKVKLETVLLQLQVELAMSDGHLDQKESQQITQWLMHRMQFNQKEAQQHLEQAMAYQKKATSIHPLTTQVSENLNRHQRAELIEELWQLAFADGHLDAYEEHFIRRLCDLIHVPHHRFIQSKLNTQPE